MTAAGDDPVRAFLAERHPALLDLALWTRALVREAEPALAERVQRGWDGVGFHHPDAGYVCGIFPRREEVRLLFEHGARLADPLLTGTTRQTRHVPLTAPDEALRPELVRLVGEAVALGEALRSRGAGGGAGGR